MEDRKKYVRISTTDRDRTSYDRFFDDAPLLKILNCVECTVDSPLKKKLCEMEKHYCIFR